jgi:hypothetical protein
MTRPASPGTRRRRSAATTRCPATSAKSSGSRVRMRQDVFGVPRSRRREGIPNGAWRDRGRSWPSTAPSAAPAVPHVRRGRCLLLRRAVHVRGRLADPVHGRVRGERAGLQPDLRPARWRLHRRQPGERGSAPAVSPTKPSPPTTTTSASRFSSRKSSPIGLPREKNVLPTGRESPRRICDSPAESVRLRGVLLLSISVSL